MDPVHNIKAISPHCLSVAGDGFYYFISLHKLQYKNKSDGQYSVSFSTEPPRAT